MADVASLGLSIESKSAATATQNLDRFAASAKAAEAAAQRLVGASQRAAVAIDKMGENAAKAGVSQGIDKGVTDGMRRAERSAAPAATALGRSLGNFIGGAIAAVLSGAAIKKALESTIDIGRKAADARMSPTTLTGLYAAGDTLGISNKEIDSALEHFSEKSKESKKDAEDFTKALTAIGKGFTEAFNKAPTQTERLRIVSEALKSTTDESKRAGLAMQAFGTDSDRVLTLFAAGRTKLDEYVQSAKALGVTVDESMVAKAREADRVFTELANVVGSNLRAVLVDIAPVIANIATQISGMADAVSRLVAAVGGAQFATSNVLRADANEARARLREQDSLLRDRDSSKPVSSVFGGGTLADYIKRDRPDRFRSLVDSETELARRGEYMDPRDRRAQASERFRASGGLGSFSRRPETGGGKDEKTEAEQAQDRLEKYTDSIARQTDVLNAQIATFGKSNAEQRAAMELAKAGVDLNKLDAETRATMVAGLVRQIEASEAAREKLEELQRAQKRIQEINELVKDSFKGIIDETLAGLEQGKNFWDALGDAGVNALKRISDKLIQMALDDLFLNAFGKKGTAGGGFLGMLGSLFSGGGGGAGGGWTYGMPMYHGGGTTREPSGWRNVHPAYFENAPRFHNGKLPWGAGEMPAIIKPDETIFTKGQINALGGMMGGSPVVVNFSPVIDNRGASMEAVARTDASLQKLKAELPSIVIKSVRDAQTTRKL